MLKTKNLTKTFGGLTAIDNIDLEVKKGEIVSLIGPNGAGKTTFFNCITGMCPPSKGEIVFNDNMIHGLKPHKVAAKGISRTFQNIRLFPEMTAMENVMAGGYVKGKASVAGAILKTRRAIDEERDLAKQSLNLLEFVGLRKKAGVWARNLSYGEQKRLEIARALAGEPVLLLLDEPAAGMNPKETESLKGLIRLIRDKGITILLIEHDMKVVMGISDRVFVLDHGVKIAEGLPDEIRRDKKVAEGLPDEIRRDKKVIEAYLGREYA